MNSSRLPAYCLGGPNKLLDSSTPYVSKLIDSSGIIACSNEAIGDTNPRGRSPLSHLEEEIFSIFSSINLASSLIKF